ncbi:hypothetical protein EDB89DRAFT_1907822 [Lactarius sanguifluus]|nr:hypothetical protein EDB89DRAFT_1907822 [Lactarius sanguifluus]
MASSRADAPVHLRTRVCVSHQWWHLSAMRRGAWRNGDFIKITPAQRRTQMQGFSFSDGAILRRSAVPRKRAQDVRNDFIKSRECTKLSQQSLRQVQVHQQQWQHHADNGNVGDTVSSETITASVIACAMVATRCKDHGKDSRHMTQICVIGTPHAPHLRFAATTKATTVMTMAAVAMLGSNSPTYYSIDGFFAVMIHSPVWV